MHGTTMVFLVVVPILAGFGNFLVPLMIGARDMAFPRLNALSYWLFLFGGIVLFCSFFATGGAAQLGLDELPAALGPATHGNGRTSGSSRCTSSRSPRSRARSTSSSRSTTCARPGMSWMRMPLFVWTIETYAALLIVVLPVLSAGLTLLLLDRQAGTHFFVPGEGGNAVLYQHVFWFFGHPEVYIMILPAMGIISEILPVFARKPIFGYKAVAFSTVAIGSSRCSSGRTTCSRSGCRAAERLLHARLDGDRGADRREDLQLARDALARQHHLRHADALRARLHRASSRSAASPGSSSPRSRSTGRCTDTYYVVAHLHYVLFGGSIFGIFGGLYYWWPKIFGRMLDERLGKVHFWLIFIGFNVTFFPQHLLGLLGMPRRIYTYEDTGMLRGVQPDLDDRLLRHGRSASSSSSERLGSRGRGGVPATTRGSPTRSSGTRPRRRRRTTSTPSRT